MGNVGDPFRPNVVEALRLHHREAHEEHICRCADTNKCNIIIIEIAGSLGKGREGIRRVGKKGIIVHYRERHEVLVDHGACHQLLWDRLYRTNRLETLKTT